MSTIQTDSTLSALIQSCATLEPSNLVAPMDEPNLFEEENGVGIPSSSDPYNLEPPSRPIVAPRTDTSPTLPPTLKNVSFNPPTPEQILLVKQWVRLDFPLDQIITLTGMAKEQVELCFEAMERMDTTKLTIKERVDKLLSDSLSNLEDAIKFGGNNLDISETVFKAALDYKHKTHKMEEGDEQMEDLAHAIKLIQGEMRKAHFVSNTGEPFNQEPFNPTEVEEAEFVHHHPNPPNQEEGLNPDVEEKENV